jgi:hypothetical protein
LPFETRNPDSTCKALSIGASTLINPEVALKIVGTTLNLIVILIYGFNYNVF